MRQALHLGDGGESGAMGAAARKGGNHLKLTVLFAAVGVLIFSSLHGWIVADYTGSHRWSSSHQLQDYHLQLPRSWMMGSGALDAAAAAMKTTADLGLEVYDSIDWCFDLAAQPNASSYPVIPFDIAITTSPRAGRLYVCDQLHTIFESAGAVDVHVSWGLPAGPELDWLIGNCSYVRQTTVHTLPKGLRKYSGPINYYAAVAAAVDTERPLLVVEDDVVFADNFAPVFSCLMRKAQVLYGSRFFLSLYISESWNDYMTLLPHRENYTADTSTRHFKNPLPWWHNAKEVAPGLYHYKHTWGIQGMVYSDRGLKEDIAKYLAKRAVHDDEFEFQDHIVAARMSQDFEAIEARGKAPVLAIERSLVQHIGKTSAHYGAGSKLMFFHASNCFLGSRYVNLTADLAPVEEMRQPASETMPKIVDTVMPPDVDLDACRATAIAWHKPSPTFGEMYIYPWLAFMEEFEQKFESIDEPVCLRIGQFPRLEANGTEGFFRRCVVHRWWFRNGTETMTDIESASEIILKRPYRPLFKLDIAPETVLVMCDDACWEAMWLSTYWGNAKFVALSSATDDLFALLQQNGQEVTEWRMQAVRGQLALDDGAASATNQSVPVVTISSLLAKTFIASFDVVNLSADWLLRAAEAGFPDVSWLQTAKLITVRACATCNATAIEDNLSRLKEKVGGRMESERRLHYLLL